MKICFTIILTPDVSYFNSPQQLYYNFATSLPIALLISLSKPYEKLTRNLCNSNFMSLENHVIFWGNIAVCISGVLVGYYYYVNSKGFVSDDGIRSFTFKYGFTSETQGCTIVFQMLLVIFIWLVIPVSRGKPWKEPIWKSKLLMLLILLNVIFLIPIYFATNKLGFLDLVPIQPAKAAVLLTIMVVTMIVCTVFNYCIQIMCTKL